MENKKIRNKDTLITAKKGGEEMSNGIIVAKKCAKCKVSDICSVNFCAMDAYDEVKKRIAVQEKAQEIMILKEEHLCPSCSRLLKNGGTCLPNTNSHVTACGGYSSGIDVSGPAC